MEFFNKAPTLTSPNQLKLNSPPSKIFHNVTGLFSDNVCRAASGRVTYAPIGVLVTLFAVAWVQPYSCVLELHVLDGAIYCAGLKVDSELLLRLFEKRSALVGLRRRLAG